MAFWVDGNTGPFAIDMINGSCTGNLTKIGKDGKIELDKDEKMACECAKRSGRNVSGRSMLVFNVSSKAYGKRDMQEPVSEYAAQHPYRAAGQHIARKMYAPDDPYPRQQRPDAAEGYPRRRGKPDERHRDDEDGKEEGVAHGPRC